LVAVFFSWLHWLPPISQVPPGETPLSHPDRLVLPTLTLLGIAGSYGIRLVRASVIEVLDHEYVAMARLNGVPESQVVRRFVLRNAMAANIQALANTTRYLIARASR
jgi:peptide/nickel transport system permease protein